MILRIPSSGASFCNNTGNGELIPVEKNNYLLSNMYLTLQS
jgi:hypothetical protein